MRSMQQEFYTDKGIVEVRGEPPGKQKMHAHSNGLKTIRVAAYCRVSTDLDVQTDSFELQERHYTQLINNTPGWHLAGIYSDQGITGTQRSRRTGFQRMLRHCGEGKIERILCKSISRFARNTMDLLDTVRILKEKNISVIFEKEGIDTLSVQSEFILSTIAAIAQDESRSISENMIWSFQRRFQRGMPVFKRILGYNIERNGTEKKITINEQEAVVVREIYDLALEGMGYIAIARVMMGKGYKTTVGKSEWSTDCVKGILKNERYTGDVLCQKTFTSDYLSHKCKRNKGEAQQYLIESHHPAIINHQMFESVQTLLKSTPRRNTKKRTIYPLSGRVSCGDCGANYHLYGSECDGRWKCSRSIKSKELCHAESINEVDLKKILLMAFELRYNLMDHNAIHKLKLDITRVQDDDNVERSRVILKRELTEALTEELQASDEERKWAIKNRIIVEGKIKEKEQFWDLLEKDRSFRKNGLMWLDRLPRGEDRMKVFFEEFNLEYIRAWVLSITILTPISFSIKWFDDTKTRINLK